MTGAVEDSSQILEIEQDLTPQGEEDKTKRNVGEQLMIWTGAIKFASSSSAHGQNSPHISHRSSLTVNDTSIVSDGRSHVEDRQPASSLCTP